MLFLEDFRFEMLSIDSTDKSRGGYSQEIRGQRQPGSESVATPEKIFGDL